MLELGDGIDMVEVANLFVGDNQRRKHLFGKFSKNDLPMKSTFASKATKLRQFNNYELTMMTLKGETFAGFKIQRQSVFYFVIDVSYSLQSVLVC